MALIKKVKFIKSASQLDQCPEGNMPEIALIGRSNAGKSSLLNAIVGQNIAKISQHPGKTTLLNFFELDGLFRLVDLPGYGYASRALSEKEKWAPMIEEYLTGRDQLKGVILVIDGVRKWTDDEDNLQDWVADKGLPLILAVNKMDRMNQKEAHKTQMHFKDISGIQSVHFISTKSGLGLENLFRTAFDKFVRA